MISEDALTGKVFTSKSAQEMGLIDGIRSMDDVFQSAMQSTATNPSYWQKTNIKKPTSKSNKMDINQLKAEYPDAYKAVLAEERDRVGAWLEFIDADVKAVVTGINSGERIGQKQTVELTRKSFYAEMKNGVEKESEETPAKSAVAPEEKLPEEKPKSEADTRLADWGAKLDKVLAK